ncbi:MAG TPA: PHP domain-containing protein [Gemmatimonadaceae bacterium]|nr:PHP domain-containing protein [Gemmatimonadaceae bacterium]
MQGSSVAGLKQRVGAIHMHSDYSHDGLDPLETMRDMCLARGIDFVGLTDHAEDFVPELFDEYLQHCAAVSDERIQFIPGLEFRFSGLRGVHLLAFGLRQWIAPRTLSEFFEQTRDTASFTAVAHPILARYDVPQVVLNQIDGVEVWNASYNTRYLPDPRAMRLFHSVQRVRPDVVAIAGLDQHDGSNDREVRVRVQSSIEDPLKALKAGEFTNTGRGMQFDSRVTLSPTQMHWLTTKRWAFDLMEQTQARLVRALRGPSPRR